MLELAIAFAAGIAGAAALHRWAAKSRYGLVRKIDAVVMGGGGPGEER
jgi:hypothetical protein